MLGKFQRIAKRKSLIALLGAFISIAGFTITYLFTGLVETALAVGGITTFLSSTLMLGISEFSPTHFSLLMVAKKSPYSEDISDGIKEILSAKDNGGSNIILIDDLKANKMLIAAAEAALNKRHYEAVVLRPVIVDDIITNYVKLLLSRDIFVVLVDLDIPDPEFGIATKKLPYYVGSNHNIGGVEAFKLSERLPKKLRTKYLIVLGPMHSSAAVSRAKSLSWMVMTSDLQFDSHTVQLTSWSPEEVAIPLENKIHTLREDSEFDCDRLVVFCPNDNICLYISQNSKKLFSKINTTDRELELCLIGYDGLKGNLGKYVVESFPCIVGTIDTRPQLIGNEAANASVSHFENRLSKQKREYLVSPIGVTF